MGTFDTTDINDISQKHMKATYDRYDEINNTRKYYEKGIIKDRFNCDLKNVPLDKAYDLIIARWSLCYLDDEEVG